MKYRISEDEFKKQKGTVFPLTRPEYKFDEKTKKLVVVGEIDIKEEVNSSAECALDHILEKYGYDELLFSLSSHNVIDSDEIADCSETMDLISIGENKTAIQTWRDVLGLDPDISDNKILSYMSKHSEDLRNKINDFKDKLAKGGTTDEAS